MKKALMVCGVVMCGMVASQASAAEVRNINFAVFQKVDSAFQFEPIVTGRFSDFITTMSGAQVLLLSHTRGSVDGDVINNSRTYCVIPVMA